MPASALERRGHIKGSGVRSKPQLNCQLSMHGGNNAMTTRGCMLVQYCKARRPTQKTADFADNVLVGHLVSNQPVTGGQTSTPSPPLCGAFLGQGHILVTVGQPCRESCTMRQAAGPGVPSAPSVPMPLGSMLYAHRHLRALPPHHSTMGFVVPGTALSPSPSPPHGNNSVLPWTSSINSSL